MARKSRQVETRLIAEYLKEHYSEFPHVLNQPLGAVSEDLQRREGYQRALGMSRPFRPVADAMVVLPGNLLLIEAKVWNVVNGLAKLPLYKSLVPITPELRIYQPRGVMMRLVVGWSSLNLEVMARSVDVELIVYCPDWLTEVIDGLHKYWTREYREEREKKMKLREFFGVE